MHDVASDPNFQPYPQGTTPQEGYTEPTGYASASAEGYDASDYGDEAGRGYDAVDADDIIGPSDFDEAVYDDEPDEAPEVLTPEVESQVAAFVDTLPAEVRAAHKRDLEAAALKLTAGDPLTAERTLYDDTVVEVSVPAAAYGRFLEEASPELREDMAYAADKIRAYGPLEPQVDQAIANGEVLGRGLSTRVHKMAVEGEPLVVRDGIWGGVGSEDVHTYRLSDAVPGNRIPHLRALSLNERKAVITEVSGSPMSELPVAERETMPDEHIAAAIDLVIAIDNAGLRTDPSKADNYTWDKDKGVGIVDLGEKREHAEETPVAEQVVDLGPILGAVAAESGPSRAAPEHKAWAEGRFRGQVTMGNRFLDVLERTHPEIIADAAAIQDNHNRTSTFVGKWSSRYFMDAEYMPAGEPFDGFRNRLERLGLGGWGEKQLPSYDINDTDVIS